ADRLPQRRPQMVDGQALLIETVASFMDGAEERIQWLRFAEAGRKASVSRVARAKRMHRHVDPSPAEIESEGRDDLPQKRILPRHRKPPQELRPGPHRG